MKMKIDKNKRLVERAYVNNALYVCVYESSRRNTEALHLNIHSQLAHLGSPTIYGEASTGNVSLMLYRDQRLRRGPAYVTKDLRFFLACSERVLMLCGVDELDDYWCLQTIAGNTG